MPATHASPPLTTATPAVVSEAAIPDSRSPSRGPLVTTSVKIADIRPRSSSGVTVWLMIERQTALTLSAAPAIASRTAAGQIDGMNPAPAIARPQTVTAPITIRPSQRACSTQPVVSAAIVAPALTDAYSSPVPLAPASYTVSASTANSARGMPNVIATRSAANDPISALFERTNVRPSLIAGPIGRCSVSVG